MENQTRFDLNAAVENWRSELSAQATLSADDRRELETHLHDLFVELKSRGLNDEESFVLARHRVGQPQKLADEFVKENPAKIWRERIFWMAMAVWIYVAWRIAALIITSLIFASCHGWMSNHGLSPNGRFPSYVTMAIHWLPLCITALILLKGYVSHHSRFVSFIYSRKKFVALAIPFIGLNLVTVISSWWYVARFNHNLPWRVWQEYGIWPLALTILVVWLMPTQNRQTSKRA